MQADLNRGHAHSHASTAFGQEITWEPPHPRPEHMPVENHSGTFDSIANATLVTARRAQATYDLSLFHRAQELLTQLQQRSKIMGSTSATPRSFFSGTKKTVDEKLAEKRLLEVKSELSQVGDYFKAFQKFRSTIDEASSKGRLRIDEFDKLEGQASSLAQRATSARAKLPPMSAYLQQTLVNLERAKRAELLAASYHAEARTAAKQYVKAVIETIDKAGWGSLDKAVSALSDLKRLGAHPFEASSQSSSDMLYSRLRETLFFRHQKKNGSKLSTGTVKVMTRWITTRIQRLSADGLLPYMTRMQQAKALQPVDAALNEYRIYEERITELRSELELANESAWKQALPISYSQLTIKRNQMEAAEA